MASAAEGSTTNLSESLIQDIHTAMKELEENGVAVIPGVIDEDVCDEYITELHAWLAKFGTGFPNNIGSIIHKYGLAHHPVAWKVRHAVKGVFSEIWGTSKLLSSMDGLSLGEPPELGRTKFEAGGAANNLHHDQNGTIRTGLHAYQGAVYLETAEQQDWCFMVINGSHKHHAEFFSEFEKNQRSEFRKITKEEEKWYRQRGCEVIRVPVPKGGIVLWDSRTVHAGAPPMSNRDSARWRYIVFVSMLPAAWASPKDLSVKVEAYKKLLCTNHWASVGTKNFHAGRALPQDISNMCPEGKTDEAKLLAGVMQYDFEDGRPNGPPKPQML